LLFVFLSRSSQAVLQNEFNQPNQKQQTKAKKKKKKTKKKDKGKAKAEVSSDDEEQPANIVDPVRFSTLIPFLAKQSTQSFRSNSSNQLERTATQAARAVTNAEKRLKALKTKLKAPKAAFDRANSNLRTAEKDARKANTTPDRDTLERLITARIAARSALVVVEEQVQQQQQKIRRLRAELRKANETWLDHKKQTTRKRGVQLPRTSIKPSMEAFIDLVDIPVDLLEKFKVRIGGGDTGSKVPCTLTAGLTVEQLLLMLTAYNFWLGLDGHAEDAEPPDALLQQDQHGRWAIKLDDLYIEARRGTKAEQTGQRTTAKDRERRLAQGKRFVLMKQMHLLI
jgi:hypothetical protein